MSRATRLERIRGRSKYGATKATVEGIRFDSKREAARYAELRLLEKAGEIKDLELQPAFPLYVRRNWEQFDPVLIGTYKADFRYREGPKGLLRIEDVKGFDVPLGRWKRRHCEAQYGIVVTVVK